jgi:hypothetical protein
MAVDELSKPEIAPIDRMLIPWEASPAASIESIIVDQFMVSMVENTRPRKRLSTCFKSFDQFKTELTATLARDNPIKNRAHPHEGIWLKRT